MNGALLTNVQLLELIQRHEIDIKPLEPERFQLAHYPIDPETILVRRAGDRSGWTCAHSFRESSQAFEIAPRAYVIVEVRQQILLSEGFVGTFVAASNLIEKGLSLTAGKISFPFGTKNERVRFGLRNNLEEPVDIGPGDLLAYLQVFDLTSSKRAPYKLSERDQEVYARRRSLANDDGVFYDEPDSPV